MSMNSVFAGHVDGVMRISGEAECVAMQSHLLCMYLTTLWNWRIRIPRGGSLLQTRMAWRRVVRIEAMVYLQTWRDDAKQEPREKRNLTTSKFTFPRSRQCDDGSSGARLLRIIALPVR